MKLIKVRKADGTLESFSAKKVRRSLQRAGASQEVIDKILPQLIGKLYQGITTQQIYQQVFNLFCQYQADVSYRYSLKQALMALGPSGYPFEQFIAKLLQKLGYQTQLQMIIRGKCVNHELDVVATKDQTQFFVECKFHQRPGTKSDVQDTLYIQARFEDIIAAIKLQKTAPAAFYQPWLITNTKLTSQAIQYGQCQGMKLTAWRYPQTDSLEQLIETNNLHPITCCQFLKPRELKALLDHQLVLCQDVASLNDSQLSQLGLSSRSLKEFRCANF